LPLGRVHRARRRGVEAAMSFVLRAAFETALMLAVAAPLIAVGLWQARKRESRSRRPRELGLIAALAVFALDNLVLRVPAIGPFAALAWGWQGKVLELALVIAVVAIAPRLTWRDVGVTAPLGRGWRAPVIVLAAVSVGLPVIFIVALGARDQLTVEGWLFEATVPGLAEELVFRGVLLTLFDRAFGRPWRIAGAEVGWGGLITAVLFAAMHAIGVDRAGSVHVEPLLALGPFVGGVFASWARARLDQIAPLIALHNLSNLIIPLASLWL
jgi:membrane protease YdiL (CAAX protease family)